jgi:hypothetical protein
MMVYQEKIAPPPPLPLTDEKQTQVIAAEDRSGLAIRTRVEDAA